MHDDPPLLLLRCKNCQRQTAAAPFIRMRKLAGHGKYASSLVWTCQHCGEIAHDGDIKIGYQESILGIPIARLPTFDGRPPAYGILTIRQIRRRQARHYRRPTP